jgi:tetratricopeptide (TPR) repeat protein
VHDHYIRKPITQKEKSAIKKFVALTAINEKQPTAGTRATAYVLQYEKFEQQAYYLDSAAYWLKKMPGGLSKLQTGIHLQYVAQHFQQIPPLLNAYGTEKAFTDLNRKSIDNKQAWTAYRISEAYAALGETSAAQKWIDLACNLAPFQLEFRNKRGNLLAAQNKIAEAQKEFEFVLSEFPQNIQALVNLGYLQLMQGRVGKAAECYSKAYALDPDYENLLLNYAGYWIYIGNKAEAVKLLKHCLRKYPQNQKAKLILAQINNTHV